MEKCNNKSFEIFTSNFVKSLCFRRRPHRLSFPSLQTEQTNKIILFRRYGGASSSARKFLVAFRGILGSIVLYPRNNKP